MFVVPIYDLVRWHVYVNEQVCVKYCHSNPMCAQKAQCGSRLSFAYGWTSTLLVVMVCVLQVKVATANGTGYRIRPRNNVCIQETWCDPSYSGLLFCIHSPRQFFTYETAGETAGFFNDDFDRNEFELVRGSTLLVLACPHTST